MKIPEALLLLMCLVVGLVLLGRRLRIPYPIVLVVGGLIIGLVPGLPLVRLDPELVFLLFLPPLLYAAAWIMPWHDFQFNLRPILLLAVGLVLFTTVIVALVVHALVPAIPLSVAFALGAIISPPDAVAAAAIAEQVGLPRRITTILEGESLVNDATGLVALKFALVAASSGYFSLGAACAQFVGVAIGGVLLGLVVGLLVERLLRWIQDETLVITISLLAPYLAYLSAERFHVSGVLSCVAAGLYGGWKSPELLAAGTRLNAYAVWNMLVFVLNCAVFILIGLELPEVRRDLGHHTMGDLILLGVIVSAVVIGLRPLWVFPATWLPRWLSKRLRQRDPLPPWRHVAIISWSGMRGVVSLAAALSLPITLADGRPFPERDLILFLTFWVILSTLVLQGLSLPYLIRWLGVRPIVNEDAEREARARIATVALAHLEALKQRDKFPEAAWEQVAGRYRERLRHLNDPLAQVLGGSSDRERLVAARRLWREGVKAERRELLRLRRHHGVDHEVIRRIQYELDLEEERMRS